MGIVRFALGFPYTFYVLAVLILFLGVTSIRVMPKDVFPEINIPVVLGRDRTSCARKRPQVALLAQIASEFQSFVHNPTQRIWNWVDGPSNSYARS
jgi:hypothetical protein